MEIDKDTLDWVETQVQKLATFRLESMELLNKRANVLVTLQIGGGGGLSAFAVNLLDKDVPRPIILGVIIAAVMLFVLAAVAVLMLMFTESVLPPGNEPQNLLDDVTAKKTLLEVRKEELDMLQERQTAWAARNKRVGIRLNCFYFATAMVPFAASALAAMVR